MGKRRSTRTISIFSWILIASLVLVVFILISARRQSLQIAQQLHELDALSKEAARLQERVKELESADAKASEFREKLLELESAASEASELREQIRRLEKLSLGLKEREDALRRLSLQILHLKTGDSWPKVRLELQVKFPAEMPGNSEERIILELEAEKMPVASLYFLEQVEAGIWSGCSFIRNAGHVLQASSVTPNGHSRRSEFSQLQFQSASIPFQEYSDQVPHIQYSIGLAGRPGGPDWYISLIDNTRNHGPGGQSGYEIPSEADPCFGRVVEGFDVVQRMSTGKTDGSSYRRLIQYIEIQHIKLVR